MNSTLKKNERRRPREVVSYVSVEAFTQAKLEQATKGLEGVDLSPLLGPGYKRFTSKTSPHSPSSPTETE